MRGLEESFYLYVRPAEEQGLSTPRLRRGPKPKNGHQTTGGKECQFLEDIDVFQRIRDGKITLMDFIPVDGTAHVIEVDDDDDNQNNFVFVDEGEEEEKAENDIEISPGEPNAMEGNSRRKGRKKEKIIRFVGRIHSSCGYRWGMRGLPQSRSHN